MYKRQAAAVAEVAAAAAASANGAPPASREADEARVAVAKKIFQRLVSADGGGGARGASASSSPSARRLHRTSRAAALAALARDGSRGVVQREVTGWLLFDDADGERELDRDVAEALIRAGVVADDSLREFDARLAERVDASGADAIACAAHLAKHLSLIHI